MRYFFYFGKLLLNLNSNRDLELLFNVICIEVQNDDEDLVCIHYQHV